MNVEEVTNWVRTLSANISENLSPKSFSGQNTSVEQSGCHLTFEKLNSAVRIKESFFFTKHKLSRSFDSTIQEAFRMH